MKSLIITLLEDNSYKALLFESKKPIKNLLLSDYSTNEKVNELIELDKNINSNLGTKIKNYKFDTLSEILSESIDSKVSAYFIWVDKTWVYSTEPFETFRPLKEVLLGITKNFNIDVEQEI